MSLEQVSNRKKKRKLERVPDVLLISDILRDASSDVAIRQDLLTCVSPSAVRSCPSNVARFAKSYCRTLFPKSKTEGARWDEVAWRVFVLLRVIEQCPAFLEILSAHSNIVRRTLFFSGNWVFASKTSVRILPLNVYESMVLLSPLTKHTKLSSPARIGFQLSQTARNSVILFTIRASFLAARIIFRSKHVTKESAGLVLDPADLEATPEDALCKAEDLKTRVDIYVDPLQKIQSSLLELCDAVVQKKCRRKFGNDSRRRDLRVFNADDGFEPAQESDLVSVNDFRDPSMLPAFTIFLRALLDIYHPFLITSVHNDTATASEVYPDDKQKQNDVLAVSEEVIFLFEECFAVEGSSFAAKLEFRRVANSAMRDILYNQMKQEDITPKPERSPLDLLSLAACDQGEKPRIVSPLTPSSLPQHSTTEAMKLEAFGLAVSYFAAAAIILSADGQTENHRGIYHRFSNYLPWSFARNMSRVHEDLKAGKMQDAHEYTALWETVILQEVFEATTQMARSAVKESTSKTECKLIHAKPVSHNVEKTLNNLMDSNFVRSSVLTKIEGTNIVDAYAVPLCGCSENRQRIELERFSPYAAVCLAISARDDLSGNVSFFAGSVLAILYPRNVKDIVQSRASGDFAAFPDHVVQAAWRVSSRCRHSPILLVRLCVQAEDSSYFENLTEDYMTLHSWTITPLCSALSWSRCVSALCGVPNNDALRALVLQYSSGGPFDVPPARQQRCPVSSEQSNHLYLATSMLRYTGKINRAQCSFMHQTIGALADSGLTRVGPQVITVQGPPGTGKTTVLAKLLSLLYSNTPKYYEPSTLRRKRQPSIRTVVCTASNAGIDHIISKFNAEGVAELRFDSLKTYGAQDAEMDVETSLRQLYADFDRGRDICSTYIGSRKLRTNRMATETIDEEDESDLRVLRLGSTNHEVARHFTSTYMNASEQEVSLHDRGSVAAFRELLAEQDIIFCTCVGAGSNSISSQVFCKRIDLIVVDEVSQASEPEVLIPLSKFLSPNTVVILIGDPSQLGPTVTCQEQVSQAILSTSLLDRRPRTQNNHATNAFCLLNIQYRMCPAIASFVNTEFYGGCLRSDLPENIRGLWLLGRVFDAVCVDTYTFCPSSMQSLQINRSQQSFVERMERQSYCNEGEATLVARICANLLYHNPGIRPADIGIVTPYAAQKKYVRQNLYDIDEAYSTDIVVDTVDAFQGNERRVMLVSLVRSEGHSIGFIGNQRRSNVAISRGRDMVIVVGNMNTMSAHSPNPWVQWSKYCASLSPSGLISETSDLKKLWEIY